MGTDEEAYETLSRLERVADGIAQANGAVLDGADTGDGGWIYTIEKDDPGWFVRGEGRTRAQALSNLIRNARAEGIAE